MAVDKKLGYINNQIVCKWLNVEIFHWISENFDLFETQKVILNQSSGQTNQLIDLL